MGVGGGGLLVIYLSLVKKTDQLAAQGINLVFFLAAAASALAVNIRNRNLDFKRITALAVIGSVLSVIGASLAAKTDVQLLRKFFGGLLVLSGIVAFFRRSDK